MRRLLRLVAVGVGLVMVLGLFQGLTQASAANTATYSYGPHSKQVLDAYWNDPKFKPKRSGHWRAVFKPTANYKGSTSAVRYVRVR